MSKAKRREKASHAVRGFLAAHPGRRHVTIDEFAGGRTAVRLGADEPASPYTGEPHDKRAVAAVFQQLQAEGVLGRPSRPAAIPWDVAHPRNFPVLGAAR